MPLLNAILHAGYHVVAVDMPGHGRSQHMPAFCGNYSAEAYIRLCAALLGKALRCFMLSLGFILGTDCLAATFIIISRIMQVPLHSPLKFFL